MLPTSKGNTLDVEECDEITVMPSVKAIDKRSTEGGTVVGTAVDLSPTGSCKRWVCVRLLRKGDLWLERA